ncbi:MAG: RagB/SusD family nutrient uptake outer membrane protein, partial [Cytophagales bacterium]|nr:RagB/SusD family nutrient uptake outer membrane protein [Cytophagales bacterium]
MNTHRIKKYLAAIALLSLGACSEKFLEPTVSTSKDVGTNVNSLGDLQGIMLGAYDRMNQSDYYGRDYVVYGDVRSDNAFSSGSSGRFVNIGQFVLQPTDANATSTWGQLYEVIANANIVINATVKDNESAEVQYVKGQALALRALAYMDLLRLYGQQYAGGALGVPLVTKFNDGELFPPRATAEQVWAQIGQDLQAAAASMDPALEDESAPNTQITTGAVYALQSRYYLYVKEYAQAAAAAKRVIDSGKYAVEPAASYLESWAGPGGGNSIFELAVTAADNPGINGLFYIYQGNYGDIEVTKDLYDAYEADDVRKELYGVEDETIRMVGKYPSADAVDNIRIIRYEEVILNYAEALAQLNSPEALTYLNLIATSRGATPYTQATVDNVLLERRKELAMEGHRFFDLLRTGKGIPYVDPRQTFTKTG